MAIYFVVVGLIFALAFFSLYIKSEAGPERRKKLFLAGAFFLLGLLMALRASSVGTDTETYSRIFYKIGATSRFWDIVPSAPVYNLYNKIVFFIWPDDRAIIVLNALIVSVSVAVFIYNFSDDVFVSTLCYVTMYCFFFSMNGTRQYVALSLLLLAACVLRRKKFVMGLLLASLAVGVHNTALIFVPFLLATPDNVSKKTLRIFVAASVILVIFFSVIFEEALGLFCRLFPRYLVYVNNAIGRSVFDAGQGRNILLTVFYAVIVAVGLLIESRPDGTFGLSAADRQKLRYLLLPCLISVAVGLAAAQYINILRLREYFTIYFICLIPSIIQCFKKDKVILNITAQLTLLIPCVVQLIEKKSGVVPYLFFWQK
ncbi:EpsG family protein [Oscillospiraceae bacterium WX1]